MRRSINYFGYEKKFLRLAITSEIKHVKKCASIWPSLDK